MVMFNRTRERGGGTKTENLKFLYIWPFTGAEYEEFDYAVTFPNKWERIDDVIPVTPWTPGAFKITDVQRFKLSSETSAVSAIWSGKYPPVYDHIARGSYVGPFAVSSLTGATAPHVPLSSEIQKLALRASAKMQSATVDTGELFAESGDALKMMAKPLRGFGSLLQSVLYFMHGSKRGQRRPLKDASNLWLELRYGWTPLVNDLQNIYNGKLAEPKIPKIMTSKASDFVSTTQEIEPYWARLYGGLYFRIQGRTKVDVVKRATYYFQVTDPGLYVGIKRGSSIVNFPKLLYNLTTLSFALDWWWDMGTWISAITPNPSVSILGFTYSYSKNEINISETTAAKYDNRERAVSARATWHRQYYLRNVLAPPHHTLPKPDLGLNSVKHAVDALALIFQRVKR